MTNRILFYIILIGLFVFSMATAARAEAWEPDDPRYRDDGNPDQDNLHAADIPRAWERARGEGMRIAILDSGCRRSHDDLDGKIVADYDFLRDDGNADDERPHGTMVASVAAGETNNRLNIAGVAPEAEILCAKITDRNGTLYNDDFLDALDWAERNGADVINISAGNYHYNEQIRQKIRDLNHKTVIVASQGNNGRYIEGRYPQCYPNVMTVTALEENGKSRWSGSGYGPCAKLAAPGRHIHTVSVACDRCDQVGSGTSYSAPTVAGAAAVIWSYRPNLSAADVRRALVAQNAVDDMGTPGWDQYFGYGRLDLHGSLLYVRRYG